MDKEEQEMDKGVAAPADPVAKRPFFYLVREKEIFASPQPDGSFCTRIMAGLRTAPE